MYICKLQDFYFPTRAAHLALCLQLPAKTDVVLSKWGYKQGDHEAVRTADNHFSAHTKCVNWENELRVGISLFFFYFGLNCWD